MREKNFLIFSVVLLALALTSLVSAEYMKSGVQYATQGAISGFFGGGTAPTNYNACQAGQDFIVQVSPIGCTPVPVRSDLLQDQNSAVFCPLMATKVNPMVSVNAIDSIQFRLDKGSDYITGVDFLPAKAALGINNQLNSPTLQNIGYAVIVLKQQKNSSKMPDYVNGSLIATIRYNIDSAFGVGATSFYLPIIADADWKNQRTKYSFLNGKFYLKAEGIDSSGAQISIYDDTRRISTSNLNNGQKSGTISLPGFDCYGGLQLSLNGLSVPDTRASLDVNGQIYEAAIGEKFFDNKCTVRDLGKYGVYESASINCNADKRGESFVLTKSPKVKLDFPGAKEDGYKVGDYLFNYTDNGKLDNGKLKGVYLGFVGSVNDSKKESDLFAMVVEVPQVKEKLTSDEIAKVARFAESYEPQKDLVSTGDYMLQHGKSIFGFVTAAIDWTVEGKSYHYINPAKSDTINGVTVSLIGFAGAKDFDLSTLNQNIQDYYTKANEDYDKILGSYLNEQNENGISYGEAALYNKMALVNSLSQKRTLIDLCEQFKENYPQSQKNIDFCEKDKLADSELSSYYILVNGKLKQISLDNVYSPKFEDYGAEILINGEKYDFKKDEVKYLEAGQTSTGTLDKTQFTTAVKNTFGAQCSQYASDVFDIANKYSVDPSRLISVMKKESSCNADTADSSAGAVGLMQISSWDLCKSALKISSLGDLRGKNNVNKNIECGAIILSSYYQTYGQTSSVSLYQNRVKRYCQDTNYQTKYLEYQSWDAALRAYNGLGCTPPGADVNYVDGVNQNYNNLKSATPTLATTSGTSGAKYVKLAGIGEDYVDVSISGFFGTKRITKGVVEDFGTGYTFNLQSINLKKLAKVTINPQIQNAGTSAVVPFKIGIEQSLIKLSPEKTKEQIDKVNNLISKWQSATNKLGNVVQGMNKACLATGGLLTLKNFLSGEALARSAVMRSSGGWYEKCQDLVNQPQSKYKNVDVCLSQNADAIGKDVKSYDDAINKQNTEIKKLEEPYTKTGILGARTINDDDFLKAYLDNAKPEITKCLNDRYPNGIDNHGKIIQVKDFMASLNSNTISIGEVRNLQLNCRLDGGLLDGMSNSVLKKSVIDVNTNSQVVKTIGDAESRFGVKADYGASRKLTEVLVKEDQTLSQITGINPIPYTLQPDQLARIYVDEATSKTYLITLTKDYVVDQTYEVDSFGNLQMSQEKNPLSLKFKKYDSSTYAHPYKNPQVRYFETDPYKGMPAIVPFDIEKGWYVSVKQTLPVLGGIRAYDESGRVNSFNICNVGENNLEENMGGDDKCELINQGTGQPYGQVFGLIDSDAKVLIDKAVDAVSQATRGYGEPKVRIGKNTFDVGEPMVDIPDIKCQDIMSPSDCKILFNVCDPVVCPSSRCDLGGNYPVKDVIQSGISGSIALCAPNFVGFGGDVYIPVCLSGVYAGMDGWLQIQKAYRDCLQNSLTTGQLTGICDEIYSLHSCEFFWRQGLPIAKYLAPKVIETIAGQSVKGGGEYLSIKSAFDNAGKSVDYFTQYYAKNSFAAFKARSAEQVGTAACKNFISIAYPSLSGFVNALTQPNSPAQFSGRFDEIPYTTATNPPLSQYKVSYFIYAGNIRGAYYQVYLKEGAESSYYQDAGNRRVVADGYLGAGERVDQTPDFVAPSGYKQLCIRVNEQETCGFKQVSTEFGVNYVKDLYMAQQANNTNIQGTKECISGSPSLYSVLSPSVEGAANEIANPAIYNRGIIRICATENPGSGSDPNYGIANKQRWREVGKCDDNMKCWLDSKSVSDVIDVKNIREGVLNNTAANELEKLMNENGYISDIDYTNLINTLSKTNDPNERIKAVDGNLPKVFLSNKKAALNLIRGDAYAELAKGLFLIPKPVSDNSGIDLSGTMDNNPQASTSQDEDVYKQELNAISDDALEDINRELIGEGIDTSGLSQEEIIQKYEEIIPKLTGGYIDFTLEEGGLSNPTTSYSLVNGQWSFSLGRTIFLGRTDWKSYFGDYKFKEANLNKLIGYEIGTSFMVVDLRNKDYDGAVKIFLDTVNFENGADGTACIFDQLRCAKLSTDGVEFGFGNVFRFKGEIGNKPLYLKFVESPPSLNVGKWYWSNDGTTYYPFVIIGDNGAAAVSGPGDWSYYKLWIMDSNLYLLAGENKDFYEVAKIIFNFNRKLKYDFVQNRQIETLKPSEAKPVIREDNIITLGFSDTLKKAADAKIINSKCADFAANILQSSKNNNIPDPLLLVALMQIESGCDKTASSEGKTFKKADGTKYVLTFELGASYGLFEISGRTWCGQFGLPQDRVSCVKMLLETPPKNIDVGAAILSKYYGQYKNGVTYSKCNRKVKYYEWDAALRAYNGFGCYKGAEYYVENVMKIYNKLGKIAEGKSALATNEKKNDELTVATLSKNQCVQAFDNLNDVRFSYGRKKLIWDERAYNLALAKSNDMYERNYYDHITPDGKYFFIDLKSKYGFVQTEYLAENIAAASVYSNGTFVPDMTCNKAVDEFLNSRAHRYFLLYVNAPAGAIGCNNYFCTFYTVNPEGFATGTVTSAQSKEFWQNAPLQPREI
ncbi:MAG: transglycosylase SLT domain-containing protein [Nanoarchaeota archaeon]